MSDEKKPALWGGRFSGRVHGIVETYTASLSLDQRLAFYDLRGTEAHVRMLARQKILSAEDLDQILEALQQIRSEIQTGVFPYREELEDIHMNIEIRLHELAGEAGRRVHTGRSRNDQIAVDLKMFCRDVALGWRKQLLDIQSLLSRRAADLKTDLFPAWTHMQAAQPMSWAHYLLAFCQMFGRDERRLESYGQLHSQGPLGAGALAGSTLRLDPEYVARLLRFETSFTNSYDVVGDRDFILELLQISSQIMIHASRMAEDFIYFISTPVGWIRLPDRLCTGSSMMPQKKNPDLLELTRGKTATVLGHASALAILLKGLPSSYQRDLQQDKEHMFACVEIVEQTLEVIRLVVEGVEIQRERSRLAVNSGFLMATDLAEYLVEKGVPFRTAHHQVGRVVAYCVERGIELQELTLDQLREIAPACEEDVSAALRPEATLERRAYKGTTGVGPVEEQIAYWDSLIEERVESLKA